MGEDLIEQYEKVNKLRRYTMKTIDHKGKVLTEYKLQVKNNDVLIFQFPDAWTCEEMERLVDSVQDSLSGDNSVLFIPKGVEIKVLEIQE